ncbi:unnamed protein product [Ascophyllum nodosum]
MASNYGDPASQSNPDEVVATHASMVLDVDFDDMIIQGSIEYTAEIKVQGANAFILDTSRLTIGTVTVDGARARWVQHRRHKVYGSALEIKLPGSGNGSSGTGESGAGYSRGQLLKVKISYCTSPRSTAIQWLPPEQTHGGKRPYLFTQGQAIHARSLVPCQDSPSLQMTYEAKVTVPSWAKCLMSALEKTSENGAAAVEEEGEKVTFSWKQPVPMPSYLIAIAVGELESRDISPRCRVWSEPGVVERAAFDFSQTEEFLQAAEGLLGPYEWGRYDVLCLPPSFPYGGMENPCLTFVTPTLLSGDKSLAFVIAHEISHSWTGNLVTNRTWEHFWLNEGWTMWLERNIMSKVTGNPDYYDFDAMQGYRSLEDSVKLFESSGAGALTKLVPDLDGVDPDDAFSSVPYEKGFALLNELQKRVGVEAFQAFAKDYIQEFRRGTVDSDEFKAFFLGKFSEKKEQLASFDWDAWFYAPGMPTDTPTFKKTLCDESQGLADKWAESVLEVAGLGVARSLSEGPLPDDHQAKFAGWSSPQKVMFLQRLLDKADELEQPFPLSMIQAIDEAYDLTKTGNSEVRFCWHKLCLRSRALFIVPRVLDFVTSMGRMKFTRPLYRELFALDETRSAAIETFKQRASFYHPICRFMVAKDLGVEPDELPRMRGKTASTASLSMSRTSSEVDVQGREGAAGGSSSLRAIAEATFSKMAGGVSGADAEEKGDKGGGGTGEGRGFARVLAGAAVAMVALAVVAAVVVSGRRGRG